jgi:hypothetical protein
VFFFFSLLLRLRPRPPFPPSFARLLWGLLGIVSTLSAEHLLVLVAFFLPFQPTFSAFTPAFSCGLSWVEGIPPSICYVSPLPPLPSYPYLSALAFLPSLPSCLSHIHLTSCLNCAPSSFVYLSLLHLRFIYCALLLTIQLTLSSCQAQTTPFFQSPYLRHSSY